MKRQVLVSLMVIAVLLFATIVPIQATWWNMDWKYKKIITITEQCMHAIEPTYSFGSEEALLSFAEQRVVALVNGSRAYSYDLDLESIAYQHLAFRSSGSEGANESANWIKEKFESFGLEAWLEPFEFTTWDLSSKPSLVIDDDGNPSTTSDQTTINSFQCEHYSWPTPESGTFADLVILPLPEAANYGELGKSPINTTEWDAINTTGKIVLIGREVRWDPDYIWEYIYQAKLRAQPPAAVVYTWWYDWMSFTPNFFSSIGGRPGSYFGPYYWDKEIPAGFVNYEDGLWIRNRENSINVSSYVSIRSVIGTGTHYNVVGKISGYKIPEKIIIISAHYDTVMSGGFCDNGAGVAGIIELAKVFTDAIKEGFYKPKYTLLFVAFAGEELCLVGSINYVKQHKSEMANIADVINLDCIGSDELYVTKTDPANGFDLDEVILDAAQDLGINATLEEPAGSDQESFRNPSWANDIYYRYWGLEAGIADATPVNSSSMLDSFPMVYGDKWTMGTPGWIHTSYDNSTSTATLNWVEIDDLENHIKVAALTIVRISPNACIIVPDDYSTIQGAINAADTGDTTYVRKGTYHEHVVVNKTVSLIGENKSNTIVDGNGTGNVITITANNVNFSGFTVQNSGPNPNAGIYVDGSSGNNISNNIMTNNYGGIFLHMSSNNTVANNTVSESAIGIQIGNSDFNTIQNNTVISNTWGGIDVWYSRYNKISYNRVSYTSEYHGILLSERAEYNIVSNNEATLNYMMGIALAGESDYNIVFNNTASYNGLDGIRVNSGSYNLIYENHASNNYRYGIFLWPYTWLGWHPNEYNIISNNTVTSNVITGIRLRADLTGDNRYNTISDNTITGSRYGVILLSSGGNTLAGNNLAGNTFNFGVDGEQLSDFIQNIDTSNTADGKPIYYLINQNNLVIDSYSHPTIGYLGIVNSTNVTVKDQVLTKSYSGILFAFTTNSRIQNVVTSGNLVGAYLVSSASNIINGVTASNNSYGIYLWRSDNNTVNECAVSNNYYGFVMDYSTNNVIYHNNIFNNTIQVSLENAFNNTWDDGYPSGGNYWSDYTGLDLCSGSYQNETGSDGIGDNPYIIDADNRDQYPLMTPYIIGVHDIAVTNVTPSKTVVGQGYSLNINVTVANQGDYTETFNLTVYANETIIETKEVTLSSGNSTTITFTWNTTGFAKGNYTISAHAEPVEDDDIGDNNCTDGWIFVGWPGDLDADGDVDEDDLWHFCGAFIDYYKIHVKDPLCDYDDDCDIDEDDLWCFCGAFIDYWKAH